MRSLLQAKQRSSLSGESLFCPFPTLEAENMVPRRGELTLIAAAPGGGKSALTLNWVMRGLPGTVVNRGIYVSADTDPITQYRRAAQIHSGYSDGFIKEQMAENPDWVDQVVKEGTRHIVFDFTGYPDADTFRDLIMAYLEVWGDYPEFIVVDNVKNVRLGDESRSNEADELEGVCEFLQLIARETNAAVIALAHVTGTHEAGDAPIPLSGLRSKISKTPELILTMFRDSEYTYVSSVKNRGGRSDSTGKFWVALKTDLGRMAYSTE